MKEIIFEKNRITLDSIENAIGLRPLGTKIGHGKIHVYVEDDFNKDNALNDFIEPKGFKFKEKKNKSD